MPLFETDIDYLDGEGINKRKTMENYYKNSDAAKKDAKAMNKLDPSVNAKVRDRRKKSK